MAENNLQENQLDLTEAFNAKQPTVIFVLLGIATVFFYQLYWQLTSLTRIHKENPQLVKKSFLTLFLVFIAIAAWSEVIVNTIKGPLFFLMVGLFDNASVSERVNLAKLVITVVTGTRLFFLGVFIIFINVYTGSYMREYFHSCGKVTDYFVLWAIIFGVYYLYFFVRKTQLGPYPLKYQGPSAGFAREDNLQRLSERLTELNNLKEQGLLTQEEFDMQKQKLLNS
jgi:uncharacterized membrane protein YoaK (UPF0700 family)